jgi:hypothetical protein
LCLPFILLNYHLEVYEREEIAATHPAAADAQMHMRAHIQNVCRVIMGMFVETDCGGEYIIFLPWARPLLALIRHHMDISPALYIIYLKRLLAA